MYLVQTGLCIGSLTESLSKLNKLKGLQRLSLRRNSKLKKLPADFGAHHPQLIYLNLGWSGFRQQYLRYGLAWYIIGDVLDHSVAINALGVSARGQRHLCSLFIIVHGVYGATSMPPPPPPPHPGLGCVCAWPAAHQQAYTPGPQKAIQAAAAFGAPGSGGHRAGCRDYGRCLQHQAATCSAVPRCERHRSRPPGLA
jgi:hypothetical protein